MTKENRLRLAVFIVAVFVVCLAIACWPLLAVLFVVVTVGWAIFQIIDYLEERYRQGSDDFEGDDSGPK